MDSSTLGNLVLLSVQVEDDTGQDRGEKNINIYIWTPSNILEKDRQFFKHGGTYIDIINDSMWDDWSGPLQPYIEEGWCETGVYEICKSWNNVRLDDKRIQVAFIDPLNKDYSARCL